VRRRSDNLLDAAQSVGKPVIIDFIGYPPPARKQGNLYFAASLSEASELAVGQASIMKKQSPSPGKPLSGYLRGLFSGGTLAYEILLGLQASLTPLFSNAPITDEQLLEDPLKSQGHTIVDLGDEFFMVGRLHPMIDNDLRIRRMKQEASDSEVAMILFDVVLGEGSHPDPASELTPAIQEIREQRQDLEFAAIVVGTQEDPQDLKSQVENFKQAGVAVFGTADTAAEYVSLRFQNSKHYGSVPVDLEQLIQPFAAINVGLESFCDSLLLQGARAGHVDWRPPAGGNEKLASLLARMKK
jgi:FdrA protein